MLVVIATTMKYFSYYINCQLSEIMAKRTISAEARLPKIVGSILSKWREGLKKPLKAVASEFGVSASTWNRWELGQRFPSTEYIARLSKYVSKPICMFYGYDTSLCTVKEFVPKVREKTSDSARNSILVVDDSDIILSVYSRMLAKQMPHARIDTAANGKEAVDMFRNVNHNVIIMDVVMPIKDGAQAFKEIRAFCASNKKEMPSVIFCTGYAFNDMIIDLVANDSRHCIVGKSLRTKDLISLVKDRASSVN